MLIAMADERSNGNAYNIGGTAMSLIELVKKMVAACGKGRFRLVPYPNESKIVEVGDYVADWSKFKEQFGWAPKVDVDEGLKRTFDYYRENRKHYW